MTYAKSILAVVGAVLAALVGVMTDGVVTNVEWVNVAVLGVGAAAIFAGPNVPGAKYTKVILAVLTAVLVLLTSLITGGLSSSELLQLAVAGLTAAGVYAVPNKDTNLL